MLCMVVGVGVLVLVFLIHCQFVTVGFMVYTQEREG